MKMIERVVIVMLSLVVVATSYDQDYNIDSTTECGYTSSYEVYDWETVHVKGGRAMPYYYSKSSKNTCKISLYADTSYMYSSRILKISVQKAVFDNYNIKVKIYDGSFDFSSDLKRTLSKLSTTTSTFETTQPYAYIVVDKTQCPFGDTACRQGFELELKVTMSDSGLTTGALIGIIIGAILGFCLLVGVPICICCCCCMAASSGGRRPGQNVSAVTTTYGVGQAYPGTTAYPTQQYVVTGTSVSPYQATSDYQTGTTQGNYNNAMAPPPYPGNQPMPNPYLQQTYPQQQQGQSNPTIEQ